MPSPQILAGSLFWVLLAVAAGMGLAPPVTPAGSEALHDDFEGEVPSWRREQTDAVAEVFPVERTDRAAHDGRKSEILHFRAGAGSALFYSYALPRIPLDLDPQARLFLKSNQAGAQILGRVVLPADVDPETKQPTFIQVPGARYDAPGRWQRLDLTDIGTLVERQAQVLRSSGKRKVSLEGAYLEALVLNAFGGPGETELFLDDLTVGPLPPGTPPVPSTTPPPADSPRSAAVASASVSPVGLSLNRLTLEGRPWFASIASAPEADPRLVAAAGFRVWQLPPNASAQTIRQATDAGLLLMPVLSLGSEGQRREPVEVAADAAAFPEPSSVAFWSLGEHLGEQFDPGRRQDELERLRQVKLALLRLPPSAPKLLTGEVAGDFFRIANKVKGGLDILGVHPPGWGSMTELGEFQTYLSQRRDLTAGPNPEATYWAMIDTTPPDSLKGAAWGGHTPPGWARARVQPAQVRMMAYAALAAGYRGWGIRGGPDLSEPEGRAMLNELAFLNAEFDLIAPILAAGKDPIRTIPTYPADPIKIQPLNQGMGAGMGGRRPSTLNPPETVANPTIRATVIATADRRGQLILVNDYAAGSQFQPPQLAFSDLRIRVQANESANAYLLSLGKVTYLDRKRVPGGIELVLPEFGPTAIILLTHDLDMVRKAEQSVNAIRSKAILMAIEQAQMQFRVVEDIHRRLAEDAHDPKDSDAVPLLKKAAELIASADEALRREDYDAAWGDARRATRPLRSLMRVHFEDAFYELGNATRASYGEPLKPRKPPLPTAPVPPTPPKGKFPPTLVSPTSSPPLVAFETLPRHYHWNDWIRTHRFGPNKIKGGNFDALDLFAELKAAGWARADYPTEGVVSTVVAIPDQSKYGGPSNKQNVWMKVRTSRVGTIDERVPFLDHPPVTLVSPPVRVLRDEFVRISVNVNCPTMSAPGLGGVIIQDSIGGEALQFRTTQPINDWNRVVLYRQVPADMDLTVTLGLAGYGDVFFDDLRVERLGEPGRDEVDTPDFANQGRRRPLDAASADAPSVDDLAGRPQRPSPTQPARPTASLPPAPTRRVR